MSYLPTLVEKMQSLLLFQHSRSLVSAAVRLNLIGPYRGQRLLVSLSSVSNDALKAVREREESVLCDESHSKNNLPGWNELEFGMSECQEDIIYCIRAEKASCQTAPVIDIVQGLHDRLYSRLFNS
jgi:urease accessory protein